MPNLLWLQGGACSGNTMSFLNAEEPSACDLVTDFGINILWHPSLGMELGNNLKKMLSGTDIDNNDNCAGDRHYRIFDRGHHWRRAMVGSLPPIPPIRGS